MSNITLFDLAQQVRDSVSLVDQETGEVSEIYAESRDLFQSKAVACVAYAKDEKARLAAARAMIKKTIEQLDAKDKRLDRFFVYLADCMKATGITEVKDDNGLFGAKLYIGRDESLVIEDGAKFPPELCNAPKPPEPSKSLIKAAIKKGEAVAGAHIVRKDRLTIN